MSLPLPKWCPATGDTIDPDDWNDNFRILYDEMSGRLNEHNHQSSAFERTDLDPSAVYRQSSFAVEDSSTATELATTADTFDIPRDGAWHSVLAVTFGDAAGMEFPGGLVWFIASFQASFTFAVIAGKSREPAMFALQIDGVLIPETVTGSGEPDNDRAPKGVNFPDPTTGDDGIGVHTVEPVVIDWLVEVDPGVHTVRLMARRPILDLGIVDDGHIKNRELIVLALVN